MDELTDRDFLVSRRQVWLYGIFDRLFPTVDLDSYWAAIPPDDTARINWRHGRGWASEPGWPRRHAVVEGSAGPWHANMVLLLDTHAGLVLGHRVFVQPRQARSEERTLFGNE